MSEEQLIKTALSYNAYCIAYCTFLELKGLSKEADEFATDYVNRLTEKDITKMLKNLGIELVEKKKVKKNGKKV